MCNAMKQENKTKDKQKKQHECVREEKKETNIHVCMRKIKEQYQNYRNQRKGT